MNAADCFLDLKDEIRGRFLKYSKKAFRMLPQIDNPRILDIGCGSGIPTLELAKISHGEVFGIDPDQAALDRFEARAKKAGLSGRIQAIFGSIDAAELPDKSFDVVWSEGSVGAVGFEKGLREWKRYLKSGGFMVVHDEQGDLKKKLDQIEKYNWILLGHFLLSKETWLREYFRPLEKLVAETKNRHPNDLEVFRELELAEKELEIFRQNPERNCSVYFVMKLQR